MTRHHYSAYGLRILSDLALPLRPDDPGTPDVEIQCADPGLLSTAPLSAEGSDVIASTLVPNTRHYWYVVTREHPGYRVRVRELGEFTIDDSLGSITWATFDVHGQQLAGVLLAGTILSLVLTLRGEPLLHASAVAVQGRTLAFTGPAGRGKSTVAALCAAAGAAVVTDDVLRLEVSADGEDPVLCRGNGGELRLRPRVWELAGEFDEGATQRATGDGRLGLLLAATELGWTQLHAIVIPSPDREGDRLAVRRVPPAEAVLALLMFPRVAGLRSADLHAQLFTALSKAVATVPVYEAAIPWGPPFQTGLGQQILDILDRSP